MRKLVDMDGVLADFERGFLREWRKRYPHRHFIPLKQRTKFYIIDEYPNLERSVRRIFRSRGFILNLRPIPGGIRAVKEMSKRGHEVFICSSPISDYRYCVLEKYAWVEKHLGVRWVRRLILTKDKTIIDTDILIDDRPEIVGVIDQPKWKHIIYDQPYNRTITGKKRLTWNNWREVLAEEY